jgi:hypothetical protein
MEINTSTSSSSNNPQLEAALKRQAQEMGVEPLPREPELLLKRISDGGFSGAFLAEAFLSAYRTGRPFRYSLGELVKLDAEGFRLFHQILHIRYVKGWSEGVLSGIEEQVRAIIYAPDYK